MNTLPAILGMIGFWELGLLFLVVVVPLLVAAVVGGIVLFVYLRRKGKPASLPPPIAPLEKK